MLADQQRSQMSQRCCTYTIPPRMPYGEAFIVPSSERQKVLHSIHEGHLGISKWQQCVHECVAWHQCIHQNHGLKHVLCASNATQSVILYSFGIDLNFTYLTKYINSDILEYRLFWNNHIFFLLPWIHL